MAACAPEGAAPPEAAARAEARPAPPRAASPVSAAAEDRAADSTFAALVARLSEDGGFFDTDNLISNERSYLHVMEALDARGIRGGAYVGVGPDQNFSYVARVRPEIAYVIDIRRDNLLQHLWFKALFELSATRVEYLSAMFSRPPPDDPAAWADATVDALVEWIDGQPYDRIYEAEMFRRVTEAVASFGLLLTADELATVGSIQHRFAERGLGLQFTSHYRGPRPSYPTYRELLTETDLRGRPGSYLAEEDAYRFLRDLQLSNRVVPVVGDLAGPHALRAIGDDARAKGLVVTAFYTSNVEFYLMRNGTFEAFAANVASLPIAEASVLIRSYFNRFDTRLPQSQPGYASTQLLQPLARFVDAWEAGGFRGYGDLVTRDALPLR